MSRRFLVAGCLLALLDAGRVRGDDANAKSVTLAQLTRRLWAVTEVVLETHVQPSSRQEMLLAAARAFLELTGQPAPRDLSRRVSGLTTEAQFTAYLAEILPSDLDKSLAKKHGVSGLFEALLRPVPGARFLSADEQNLDAQIRGNRYVGTGIQIGMNQPEQLTQILIPIPGGPARKAGARPGDLIVSINGVSMKGRPLGDIVQLLRGGEGTVIDLEVRQPGADKSRTLKVTRGVAVFETVQGYHRTAEDAWDYQPDPAAPVGYVRLEGLTSSTAHELRKLEPKVLAGGPRGIVLDLRSGGGGDLHHAAQVADELLDGGLLWRVRDGPGRVREVRADRDCVFRGLPLVVLVDEGTAGPGTMVAAALQDNGRALVVGVPTRGGNVMATAVVDLPEGIGAVELWTGKVERAKTSGAPKSTDGEVAHPLSVQPDQVVEIEARLREAVANWQRAQASPAPPAGAVVKRPPDPQLEKAVALLLAEIRKSDAKKG
jgi:C-terminal peptidase prc